MIEDIEGGTPEPTRRPHIVALSAFVAAISLAVFIALILPGADYSPALVAASPSPSASGGIARTIVSNPMSTASVDWTRAIGCPEGSSRAVAVPTEVGRPTSVVPLLDPRAERPAAMWSSAGTSRTVAVTYIYDREGRYVVVCAPFNTDIPPERRIPD